MMATIAVFLAMAVKVAAIWNGIPDNGSVIPAHKFAGYLGIPYTRTDCPTNPTTAYASCGCSLVDLFPEEPALARRIVLSAGHCLTETDGGPFKITWEVDPKPVLTKCTAGNYRTGFDPTVKFYETAGAFTKYVEPNTPRAGDPKPGQAVNDYGILVLKTAAAAGDADLANVVGLPTPAYLSPGKNQIPVVGMAGYGVAGYGVDNTTLGKPDIFNGARSRMYIEMDVKSITKGAITTSMNAAQQDPSACGGDSGSAAFPPKPDTVTGRYTVLGVTSSGDQNCRATNTAAPVGTADFYAYLKEIKPAVCAAAGVKCLAK